uniref:PORR domain-containing protein n=2 Tax=Nymphaea colorata TaxID=210225 RepID=A0A5K1GUF0_9MAGN
MRLEDRTRDIKFDKLVRNLRRLKIVLRLQKLILDRKSPYVSVQIISKWRRKVSLNIGMGIFLRKYPHIFEIFTHPVKRNACCRLTRKMIELIEEENNVIREMEFVNTQCLKKLLMISTNGSLHIHAIRLITRELGLPDDFKDSIILKYPNDFRMVDNEILELVSRDESLASAEIEKWREKEYTEKWLSEFETRYAFQIQFPTGYKIEKGFREKLRNWQRLPYLKPYEKPVSIRVRSCGGVARFEKRAVGILHEFLSLTVEKMIDVERISHFRKDFGMEINVRELLLKHPGIFYISTKGNTQTVFLREAYSKGNLIEPNPVYVVRRKILDLLLLGQRCGRGLRLERSEQLQRRAGIEVREGPRDGDWVIPILDDIESEAVGGDTSNEDDDESLYDLHEEVGGDSIGNVGDDCEGDDAYFTSISDGDSCIEK